MNYIIKPYDSIGMISLGMSRESVREIFDNKFREFRKNQFSENTTDDFMYCHVYYDTNNICEAVELFEPAEVSFNEFEILGVSYNLVEEFFRKLDNSIDINDAGFTSYKYGIGIFAPYAIDEPEEPVESVIVFKQGYYE
ncbi:hypothetical protein [Clostridium manihotivorum]|uniref:Uncharacterized protein n=1 Tax=Clostridium manihotivorum TaxID=2320868 RepID=A0A410DPU8_9CLOT|nr:hypothetical protein [Clostridium manihotivorum]QAA31082.1 hypothetical protein C1I91_05055 [Clostridium manihotivorum]